MLVRALGGGAIWVFSAALLQTLRRDDFRGRVASFEFAAFTLVQSMSTLWAGYAQDVWHWSVWQLLRLSGVSALVMVLLWLLFQRWVARQPLARQLG